MYHSAIAHYRNKYPGGHVSATDDSVDVFDTNGQHRVALRKNGCGQWVCVSEQLGLPDRHDFAPIPRDARLHKVAGSGQLVMDDKAKERDAKRVEFVDQSQTKILSCAELQAMGYAFDEKGNVTQRPQRPLIPTDPRAGAMMPKM